MEGLGVQYLGIDEYNTFNAEAHAEEWRDSDPAWLFASVLEQAGVIPRYSMRTRKPSQWTEPIVSK